MMKKAISASIVLLLALVVSTRSETRVLEGYLVDAKCASYYRESQPDKLSNHSRACAMACGRQGGYGLVAVDQ